MPVDRGTVLEGGGVTLPANPPIFHITHIDNLPSILEAGGLLSDATRRSGKFAATNIGHLHIKGRRMRRSVPVAPGGVLGDYVPFNFCSRSVMLCAVWRRHGDYQGGEDDVVHLVSSVGAASSAGLRWAFTDRHAELAYAQFFANPDDLDRVRWDVMRFTWWQNVKEERQAEFLVHEFFPWTAIDHIVVKSQDRADRVQAILTDNDQVATVVVNPNWYYEGTS